VNQAAENAFTALMTPDHEGRAIAVAAEKDGFMATFSALVAADGGVKLDALGRFAPGSNLTAFLSSQANRPKHYLNAEQIKNASPTASGRIDANVVERALARAKHKGLTALDPKATTERIMERN
jgi:hypothetical protein